MMWAAPPGRIGAPFYGRLVQLEDDLVPSLRLANRILLCYEGTEPATPGSAVP
jgi:hypothetical protein